MRLPRNTELSAGSPVVDYTERRDRVFTVFAGVFLCAMTLLNVIGITKFVQIGPMTLAVGVLAYPLTFLCTDLISELYGKSRANFLVLVGLLLNGFVLLVLFMGQYLPSAPPETQPPWQQILIDGELPLPTGNVVTGTVELFEIIYLCTSGSVAASMCAYMAAQFCDVQLYHFWKKVTKGKHLWMRNNFSTLLSQGVDSFAVISVTFGGAYFAGQISLPTLFTLMGSNYLFKMLAALVDTGPMYLLTARLRPYLGIEGADLQEQQQANASSVRHPA